MSANVDDDASRYREPSQQISGSEYWAAIFLSFFQQSYHVRTDRMALNRSPDLFAHRFYVLVLFFCFSYS